MENEIYDIIRGVNAHSVEEALRDFLNQSKRKHVTDVTFADAMLLYIGRGKHLVYDAGSMYESETDGNALYQLLHSETLANIVHNVELSPIEQGEALFRANATRTNNIIRIIKNRIHRSGYFADAPQGIALKNGFLRIEDKEVKHDKPLTIDHRQRHALYVSYNPDANAAAIDDFLFSVLEDQALVSFIYELFGIAVFGMGGSYHKFVIFYGSGRNGKGAVSRLLRKLLGEGMCSNVGPEEMEREYNRIGLYGSRANIIGELPDFKKGALKYFKMATGGDSILLRDIGKASFNYKPIAQHIALTNDLPLIKKVDPSITGRMLVVPFNVFITPEKRIIDIEDGLFEEHGEGFLRRIVEGMQRVLDRGRIAEPDAVRRATDAWLRPHEGVLIFADECLESVSDSAVRISAEEMYAKCCTFCHERRFIPPSSKIDLNKKLTATGFHTKQSDTMFWIGVRFKS